MRMSLLNDIPRDAHLYKVSSEVFRLSTRGRLEVTKPTTNTYQKTSEIPDYKELTLSDGGIYSLILGVADCSGSCSGGHCGHCCGGSCGGNCSGPSCGSGCIGSSSLKNFKQRDTKDKL